MHLLHHIDFKIAADMYLVEVSREYFTAAQARIVRNIKSHFPLFNEFLLSGVLSQDSWISRFCKAGANDRNKRDFTQGQSRNPVAGFEMNRRTKSEKPPDKVRLKEVSG